MENEKQPKRTTRRARRGKKIVEVLADLPISEEAELEAAGFEKKRARNEKGHFVKDDPSTPENEAFEWQRPVEEVTKTPIVEPPSQPTPEPRPEVKPWVRPVRPMKAKTKPTNQTGPRRR
tara:strand:+ start:16296 stop:16655 length:360 start_codon:yes stop_codon:yes gene_type:complete